MPLVTNLHKGLEIRHFSENAGENAEAIIAGHGGYSEPMCGCLGGSGKTQIPSCVAKVHFYAEHGSFSIGFLALKYFRGDEGLKDLEPLMAGRSHSAGTKITNYNLGYREEYYNIDLNRSARNDKALIVVKEGKHPKMSDLFAAIKKYNLRFKNIYYLPCASAAGHEPEIEHEKMTLAQMLERSGNTPNS